MAATEAKPHLAKSATGELVRLPYGCDAAEVLEVVRRDGGLILTGVMTSEQVEGVNAEFDPVFGAVEHAFGHGEDSYVADFSGHNRDGRGLLAALGIQPDNAVPLLINTLLALNDVTEEIGATRIIPGSHTWADQSVSANPDDSIPVLLNKGEVFFYTGEVLHGGGANRTRNRSRRLISTGWSLPILVGEEAWPFVFTVDEVRDFPPRLQQYLGFRSICYRGEDPGFLWRVNTPPLQTYLGLDDDV